jgi:hypothetical protein
MNGRVTEPRENVFLQVEAISEGLFSIARRTGVHARELHGKRPLLDDLLREDYMPAAMPCITLAAE